MKFAFKQLRWEFKEDHVDEFLLVNDNESEIIQIHYLKRLKIEQIFPERKTLSKNDSINVKLTNYELKTIFSDTFSYIF